MDKSHKDPGTIDMNAPRHAQYMHKAWKKHQNTENWVDINFAQNKGWEFYQTRSNAIIFHETLPAYCIPKVVRLKTGEVLYEKIIHVSSTTTKGLLETRMEKKIRFRTCWQLSRSFQSNQPTLNPIRERTERPVIRDDARTEQDGRKNVPFSGDRC